MKKDRLKFLASLLIISLLLQSLCVSYAMAVTVLLGDADQNGKIEASDARYVLRTAVGLNDTNVEDLLICDVDQNGYIEAADARIILRVAVELESLNNKTVELGEDETTTNPSGNVVVPINPEVTEVIVPTDIAVPKAPAIDAVSGTFTFTIYGNGHGVGLSQCGASYLADKGYNYESILHHYYNNSVFVDDDAIPEKATYKGTEYSTPDLVAKVTATEIGVVNAEAIKAQAVAVYTLLRRCDFNDSNGECGALRDNGVWSSTYFESLIKPAVYSVFGRYIARADDFAGEPALTVYSAMSAGKTVNCSDIWFADYPVSVPSPFEMTMKGFVHNAGPFTAAEMKRRILNYDSTIKLSSNPAEWFDILQHNASVSEDIGYVTQLLVGDTVLSGVEAIDRIIDLSSGCYVITYTP